MLIFYYRSDRKGLKTSEYFLSETASPDTLLNVLKRAYGIKNRVNKIRNLYLAGRTRIHLDRVENLGDFIELEVVLDESESEDSGRQEADSLMYRLEIHPEDLIDCAYVDMLDSNLTDTLK